MKRTVIILAGLATLGGLGYLGSRLYAQQPYPATYQQTNAAAPAAQPRTKIAVVNLAGVIRQYQKWQNFDADYKAKLGQYDKAFEARKAQAQELKAKLEKATDETSRDQIQQEMRKLDREVQDEGENAKKYLNKYRDDVAVQIYREIHDAVQRYAAANDIELVLHYSDALNEADFYHPLNVQRKLASMACLPMYVAPGMDITNIIAANLNQKLQAQAQYPTGGQPH